MNIKCVCSALAATLVLSACQPQPAEEQNMKQPRETTFTLEEMFNDDLFKVASTPATRWLADGSGYTTLEDNAQSGKDIVRYHPETQERTVLVTAQQLTPMGAEQALDIADYRWSNDGTKVIIFTNTVRSWRTHTLGDYWVLDLQSEQLVQLGKSAPESSLHFAKLSTQGDRVAYVKGNNLYIEHLQDSSSDTKVEQLTFDGSPDIINGTFDWVNEEEFGLRDGFRWSPNGEYLAYWQVDQSEVKEFTLIDNISSNYPQFKSFPYPKVGEVNSALRVGVIPAAGGNTKWMKLPG